MLVPIRLQTCVAHSGGPSAQKRTVVVVMRRQWIVAATVADSRGKEGCLAVPQCETLPEGRDTVLRCSASLSVSLGPAISPKNRPTSGGSHSVLSVACRTGLETHG